MNPGIEWPDIAIAGILLLAALRGFKRGFIAEVGGLAALAIAVWAALTYAGGWDRAIEHATDAGPAIAHWIGMGLYAFAAFTIASLCAWAVERIAKLPIIGIGNGLLGALTGLCKGVLLAWFIVYCVLFLPLGPHVRADLRQSKLVAALSAPNAGVDTRVQKNVPGFARPFTGPFFRRHHV